MNQPEGKANQPYMNPLGPQYAWKKQQILKNIDGDGDGY